MSTVGVFFFYATLVFCATIPPIITIEHFSERQHRRRVLGLPSFETRSSQIAKQILPKSFFRHPGEIYIGSLMLLTGGMFLNYMYTEYNKTKSTNKNINNKS